MAVLIRAGGVGPTRTARTTARRNVKVPAASVLYRSDRLLVARGSGTRAANPPEGHRRGPGDVGRVQQRQRHAPGGIGELRWRLAEEASQRPGQVRLVEVPDLVGHRGRRCALAEPYASQPCALDLSDRTAGQPGRLMEPALDRAQGQLGGATKRVLDDRLGSDQVLADEPATGLHDRLGHRPSELSGGQQQRVAVARALANRPAVLIADEPSGNLDSHTSEQLHDLFFRLRADHGVALVLATHNRELADRTDRVLRLKDGRLENLYPDAL